MSVAAFLAELRSRDLQVWAEGDQLRCNAPAGVLTPALQEELRRRKRDILEFLHFSKVLTRQEQAIVPLQPRGQRAPVFALGGHNGDVFCYRPLAQALGDDQPLFGLQPPGLDGKSEPLTRVEALAAYFAEQIRAFRPSGPYVLAGYCAGGTIAFELAQQLQRQGGRVSFVALIASPYSHWYRHLPQLRARVMHGVEWASRHVQALASMSGGARRRYIAEKLRWRQERRAVRAAAPPDPARAVFARVQEATLVAVRRYTPRRFEGRVGLFVPNAEWLRTRNALLRWRAFASDPEEYCGPDGCKGELMLEEPYAPVTAELIRRCRDRLT